MTAIALTESELSAVTAAAKQRWAQSGLTDVQWDALDSVSYAIVDLAPTELGKVSGSMISIDIDAAGKGWFIDETPYQDEEFSSAGTTALVANWGGASVGIDLLTLLMHEQGHILGLGDMPSGSDNVMNGLLGEGQRRLPGTGQAEGAVPGSVAAPAYQIASGNVFINEFHYDNVSTDTGEFIEIAGPAGTDLTGWSIVRYNGSGGVIYTSPGSINLTGVIIDDEGAGVGAVSFSLPTDGLQNGAPDGIALVDGTGTLVEFLSYEGAFAGTAGAANGVASTDVGVTETSSTPVGQSLQRTGTGSTAGDFTWTGTFGGNAWDAECWADAECRRRFLRSKDQRILRQPRRY